MTALFSILKASVVLPKALKTLSERMSPSYKSLTPVMTDDGDDDNEDDKKTTRLI